MKAAILSIGDELLIGQVSNTNATWLGIELTKLGYIISEVRTIGDNFSLAYDTISLLSKSNDLIIITGGLGPTHDDITKFVICDLLNKCKLKIFHSQLDFIKKRLSERGHLINERNENQALIPENSTGLFNNYGAAAGIKFVLNQASIYSLPGVPVEMKGIFQDCIINDIKLKNISNNQQTFVAVGIPESILADYLIACEELVNEFVSLAYLPNYSMIRLRVMRKNDSKDSINRYNKIIEVINDKAKEYIIWDFDEKLEVILGKKLIKKSLTISTVESCTGGLLGSAITSVAGSSEYYIGGIIAYSNEIKCKELNVPIDILENFGAVSKETAEILAYEQRLKFKTDLSISITGIAGPAGGSLEKPVGTVYIGISTKFKTFSKLISMGLGRDSVRQKTVITALIMLIKEIDLIDLI